MAKKFCKIPNSARIRLVIDCVAILTTADLLRNGSGSTIIFDAFRDFEREHSITGILGRTLGYHDRFLGRTVNIQIDLQ